MISLFIASIPAFIIMIFIVIDERKKKKALQKQEPPKQLTSGKPPTNFRNLRLCKKCEIEVGDVMVSTTSRDCSAPKDRFSEAEIHFLCHCEICGEPVEELPSWKEEYERREYHLRQIRF